MIEETFSISKGTRIGYVNLTVANFENQIDFYTQHIGLKQLWKKDKIAALGAGEKEIIRLMENKDAKRFSRTTGLYHIAILLPSRSELARMIAKLYELKYANYPTDHTISQSTYLTDPEGNGIEIYTDTPWEGRLEGLQAYDKYGNPRPGTDTLDLEDLFKELKPGSDLMAPLPDETRTGHVHLHVDDLDKAMNFYSNVLGFEKYSFEREHFRFGDVGVPGYNVHMIAFNTWQGENAPIPPPDSLGLKYFTIDLPDPDELKKLTEHIRQQELPMVNKEEGILINDPAGNGILLREKR